VILGELFPRVGLALFHAERNATAVLVDFQDHHLDFVADLHHLARVDVLVGPVHLGDVHQPFDARLDFHESAVVGEVRDLAEQARAGRIAAGDADPGILAELFQAQGDAHLLAVELEHLGLDLVADVDDFGRMAHAAPGEIGDVQQPVDAAQVDEGAVIGDVLDHTLDDGALLQGLEQLFAILAHGLFEHGAARHDDVVTFAVDLDDLELELFTLDRSSVLHRADVDEGTGQEGAQSIDHDGEAALDAAGDHPLDDAAFFESCSSSFQASRRLAFSRDRRVSP